MPPIPSDRSVLSALPPKLTFELDSRRRARLHVWLRRIGSVAIVLVVLWVAVGLDTSVVRLWKLRRHKSDLERDLTMAKLRTLDLVLTRQKLETDTSYIDILAHQQGFARRDEMLFRFVPRDSMGH